MATVYGVQRTLIRAGGISNICNPGMTDGRHKVILDTYEAASVASGTTIEMGGVLPTGCIVTEVTLMTDALGGGVTLAVGDAESTSRYISATTCNTANLVTRMNAIDGRQYSPDMTTSSTPDNQITITTGGGTATGTIKLMVEYVND